MNPFEVLGLEASIADRAAIRAAYARQVRLHPPDGDAGQFRRIRDAYEALRGLDDDALAHLASCRVVESEGDADPIDDDAGPVERAEVEDASAIRRRATNSHEEPAPARKRSDPRDIADIESADDVRVVLRDVVASESDREASIRGWRARFDEAAGSSPDGTPDRAIQGVRSRLHEEVPSLAERHRLLCDVLGEAPEILVLAILPEDVVAFVVAGHATLPSELIRAWEEREWWKTLVETAEALLVASPALIPPAAPVPLVELSDAIAVVAPTIARRLSNRAFELAPPDLRRSIDFERAEFRARISEDLPKHPEDARRALASLFRLGGLPPGGIQSRHRALIYAVARRLAGNGPLVEWLRGAVPSILDESLAVARVQASDEKRRRSASLSRGGPLTTVIVLVALAGITSRLTRSTSMLVPRAPISFPRLVVPPLRRHGSVTPSERAEYRTLVKLHRDGKPMTLVQVRRLAELAARGAWEPIPPEKEDRVEDR